MSKPTCLTCKRIASCLAEPGSTCPAHPYASGTFANPDTALKEVTFADVCRAWIRIRNMPGGKP